MLRKAFTKLIRVLARRVINRYKPVVIGVTGSVGKTTTKEAISAVLERHYKIRKSEKNYNDAVGIPMTVLGIRPLEGPRFSDKLQLSDDLIKAIWLAYGFPKTKYPKVLVLELGADKPGDISNLTDIVKPTIGVVTAIGDVPVHVEFYANPQAVAREKSVLIKSLPTLEGLAILNKDDPTVAAMKDECKSKVITFGFGNEADYWVSDVNYYASENGLHVGGMAFKIHKRDSFIPVRINDMIAPQQIYAILAAAIVGSKMGINMVDMATDFERIDFPNGRMKLIKGVSETIIIDDTYNASPLSTHAALESLNGFTKAMKRLDKKRHRKVAILGDMAELGRYSESSHRAIGGIAAGNADVVIGVGDASVFVVEEAKKELGETRVVHFSNSMDLVGSIGELIKPRDIILIKGSQSQRMEYVVQVLMEKPEFASQLLVRQTERWK